MDTSPAAMKKQYRGGAINYQKGNTDTEYLADALSHYVKQHGPLDAFQLGEYHTLSANHAVRGPALAKIGQLVLCLLKVRSDACITYSDLKITLSNLLLKFPELKQQKHHNWAADMADRLMVILKHTRSLALGENCDIVWKRATTNVPHYLMPVMQQIRNIIKGSDAELPAAEIAETHNTKRKLVSHDSNVSVDEMGLPALSWVHHAMKVHKDLDPLDAAAEELGIVPPTKQELKGKMGFIKKKPAGAKEPSVMKSVAKGTKAMQVTTTGNCKIDKVSLRLQGPFQKQSYITHLKPPKLIVACTKQQHMKHHDILKKVLLYITKQPYCTKAQAVAKRDELLKNA
jgi:hypothetical protein